MNLDSVSLFNLASQRLDWLAARQKAISENIANADTPAYRARDVAPFEEVLDGTASGTAIAPTDPKHISHSGSAGPELRLQDDVPWEQSIDGNTVVLEQQVIRAAEIEDQYRLAADLYRKAHDLLTLATTGRK